MQTDQCEEKLESVLPHNTDTEETSGSEEPHMSEEIAFAEEPCLPSLTSICSQSKEVRLLRCHVCLGFEHSHISCLARLNNVYCRPVR